MSQLGESASDASSVHRRLVISVQAAPHQGCPMHGKNGSFKLPEAADSSRKDLARELRAFSQQLVASKRSQSIDQVYPVRYSTHSMPRSMSRHDSVDRRGQQKPPPRDVFRGRVEFQSTLRRSDPKEEERGRGEPLTRSASHPITPRRGTIVDSDFDFRYGNVSERERQAGAAGRVIRSPQPPSSRPMSPTFVERSRTPNKMLRVDIEAANMIDSLLSRAAASDSTPTSPGPLSPSSSVGRGRKYEDSVNSWTTNSTPRADDVAAAAAAVAAEPNWMDEMAATAAFWDRSQSLPDESHVHRYQQQLKKWSLQGKTPHDELAAAQEKSKKRTYSTIIQGYYITYTPSHAKHGKKIK